MEIKQKFRIKTYDDEYRLFEEIGEISKIRKIWEIMLLKKKINIKNSLLDHIRYTKLNCNGHVQRMDEEMLPRKTFEWCPPGRRRRERPWNSLIAGGYNTNEGVRGGGENWRLGVGRQEGVEKENKTLGTERCENIKNLYINKNI